MTDTLCRHECPSPLCILCGRTELCGLTYNGSSVCMFDQTYTQVCDMLQQTREALRDTEERLQQALADAAGYRYLWQQEKAQREQA